MSKVSFSIGGRENLAAIKGICERAERMELADVSDRISSVMDLSATHANGCPMDFVRMLAADDFNFAHDFCGIQRHIDRETGKLGGCFLPRFAARA